MGLVEDGEAPEEAAARDVLEETGWRPGPIKPLIYAGPPTEKNESDRISWPPLAPFGNARDRHADTAAARDHSVILGP
jgi:ADP-ribose pyrophosphatase YjhB (NUDIX family)